MMRKGRREEKEVFKNKAKTEIGMNYSSTTIPNLTVLKDNKGLECLGLKVTKRLYVERNQ